MTPAQVAAACGLKDPDAYVREMSVSSTDGRKRGYTTRMLCQAVAHASEGKEVVVVVLPPYVQDETMIRMVTGMAARAGLRLQRIDGQRAWYDRGSIRVVSSQDAGPWSTTSQDRRPGDRVGLVVLRDHLVEESPVFLPAQEWTCHHRVPRDGKRCVMCGADLRGGALRDARRRRAEYETAQTRVETPRLVYDLSGTVPAGAEAARPKP